MVHIMRQCKLEATSKRGKQLITEHGDTWYLVEHGFEQPYAWRMQCFDNALGFTIKSLNGEHTRNVKMIDDKNFNIYYIMEQL